MTRRRITVSFRIVYEALDLVVTVMGSQYYTLLPFTNRTGVFAKALTMDTTKIKFP